MNCTFVGLRQPDCGEVLTLGCGRRHKTDEAVVKFEQKLSVPSITEDSFHVCISNGCGSYHIIYIISYISYHIYHIIYIISYISYHIYHITSTLSLNRSDVSQILRTHIGRYPAVCAFVQRVTACGQQEQLDLGSGLRGESKVVICLLPVTDVHTLQINWTEMQLCFLGCELIIFFSCCVAPGLYIGLI